MIAPVAFGSGRRKPSACRRGKTCAGAGVGEWIAVEVAEEDEAAIARGAGNALDLVPVPGAVVGGQVHRGAEADDLELERGQLTVQPVGGGGFGVAGERQQAVVGHRAAGRDQDLVLARRLEPTGEALEADVLQAVLEADLMVAIDELGRPGTVDVVRAIAWMTAGGIAFLPVRWFRFQAARCRVSGIGPGVVVGDDVRIAGRERAMSRGECDANIPTGWTRPAPAGCSRFSGDTQQAPRRYAPCFAADRPAHPCARVRRSATHPCVLARSVPLRDGPENASSWQAPIYGQPNGTNCDPALRRP